MSDKREMFERYLQEKPGDRFAMYSLAFELEKAGEFAASIKAYEALLALHPGAGAGWLRLGKTYGAAGDEAAEAEAYRRGLSALEADPEAAKARGELEAALDLVED